MKTLIAITKIKFPKVGCFTAVIFLILASLSAIGVYLSAGALEIVSRAKNKNDFSPFTMEEEIELQTFLANELDGNGATSATAKIESCKLLVKKIFGNRCTFPLSNDFETMSIGLTEVVAVVGNRVNGYNSLSFVFFQEYDEKERKLVAFYRNLLPGPNVPTVPAAKMNKTATRETLQRSKHVGPKSIGALHKCSGAKTVL